MTPQEPLWRPSPERISTTRLTAFVRYLEAADRRSLADYSDLHRWSVQSPADFWRHVWTFCGGVGQLGTRAIDLAEQLPGARFFPDSRLNFTENLLRRRDDAPAVIATTEHGRNRELTFATLFATAAPAAT